MKVGAVVQARLSSTRLPGKVLKPMAGAPLLAWLIDGLRQATSLDTIVLATSDLDGDTPLAAFGAQLGVPVFRGPLEDVAARMLGAAQVHEIDVVVRVCADSPLLDPAIVDRVVAAYLDALPDLATNVFPRSFPVGQSAEVFSREALARAHPHMDPHQREHATQWFYDHAGELDVVNVAADRDLSALRHCVDTPEDFAAVERLLETAERRPWEGGMARLVKLSEPHDEPGAESGLR